MLKNRGLASKGAEVTGQKDVIQRHRNNPLLQNKKAIQMRKCSATQQMKFAVCTKCKRAPKWGDVGGAAGRAIGTWVGRAPLV